MGKSLARLGNPFKRLFQMTNSNQQITLSILSTWLRSEWNTHRQQRTAQGQFPMRNTKLNLGVPDLFHFLFVGYLLMQGKIILARIVSCTFANKTLVASKMILTKLSKPPIYLPTCMLAWRIISGTTAATQNYWGLLPVDSFLALASTLHVHSSQLD